MPTCLRRRRESSLKPHSIREIADADSGTVEAALKDPKSAKSLQSACRKWAKDQQKRPGEGAAAAPAPAAKRQRQQGTEPEPTPGPDQIEKSLELPVDTNEDEIASTSVCTNRAPLLMAFTFQLLRYTMPQQPPSSRLSLAQAVVSMTSRSAAANMGIGKEPIALEDSWTSGQPKVRIMGRTFPVLKRSGYSWKGDEEISGSQAEASSAPGTAGAPAGQPSSEEVEEEVQRKEGAEPGCEWVPGPEISLKGSTFIAHVAHITDGRKRAQFMASLIAAKPILEGATHNAWATRIQNTLTNGGGTEVRENHFDDGETGCGNVLLQVMEEAGAVDTMAVLSRWFGGTLLGPDRWRLMKNALQGALAERWRRSGAAMDLDGDALWALDPEGSQSESVARAPGPFDVVGANIFRPESARSYLLKNFTPSPSGRGQRGSKGGGGGDDQDKLGLLLGALELLFESWADHVSMTELDGKAWAWYLAVRPRVASGPDGWGSKGTVTLSSILDLRRQEQPQGPSGNKT